MIGLIFKIAENFWNKLAKINFWWFDFFWWILNLVEGKKKFYVYQLKPFKDNENGVAHWKGFLTNFSSLNQNISFCIFWNAKDIKIYVKVFENLKNYFENTFYANFGSSDLVIVKDWFDPFESSELKYLYFDKTQILSDQDFKKDWIYLDPMKDVISLFSDINDEWDMIISYNINFHTKDSILKKAIKYIFKKNKPVTSDDDLVANEVKFTIWYWHNIKDNVIKSKLEQNVFKVFEKFKKWWKIINKNKYNLATYNQMVNFFHLPTKEFFIKNFDYLVYRKLPYPPIIPTRDNSEKNDITLLWITDYKNDNIRFWIRNEDKFRHVYIIWKTGMWKSTLMSNMARSDMITNKWMALIDPHGDLVETLLEHVPSWRSNDVILFDVSDTKYPIWFNILQYDSEDDKILVVSWIVWTFKKLYGESWWPRLEYILRNVMLSVIEYPNATLMHIVRMLTDKNFKEEVLTYVKDPIVLKFWRNEFDKRTDKFRDEAISPIANKVWQFLSSPIVRNIFWQPKTKLNFRKIMDEWKILLINLSKWKIWEDNAEMIWSFIVTKLQIDAMSRADIPMDKRRDFYLYIDEFQNFATDSFENILSEARKYKLSLIVANQYVSQLDEKIRNAIFGNVWTIFSFALWHSDAVLMSSQFKDIITPNDLLSLPKFRAYVKLMIDWVTSDPFCMSTFPLPTPENSEETKEKIRKQSRQRYAMEKERLDVLIKNWSDKKFSAVEKVMEMAKQQTWPVNTKPENTPKPKASPEFKEVKTQNSIKEESQVEPQIVESPSNEFGMKDIKIWDWYDWLVKLKYNYWLFVTVRWVEWLLHKKLMNIPDDVRWKDMYNIWDKISVKAMEFKELEWQKKIVWTQV